MLSEAGITLFGHTITTMQILLAGAGLLCASLLLALLRAKHVALRRSVVTDEMAIQLGRIATAVEQLAGEAAARRIREERASASVTLPPVPGEERHPVSYSMFGR